MKRCRRQLTNGFFCQDHRLQWIHFSVFMIFTVGGGALAYVTYIQQTLQDWREQRLVEELAAREIVPMGGRLTIHWQELPNARGHIAAAGPVDVQHMVLTTLNDKHQSVSLRQGRLAKNTGNRTIFVFDPVPITGDKLVFKIEADLEGQTTERKFEIERKL